MKKKEIFIIILINLIISIGFFIENYGVGFSEISSDSQNAIPICYKLDEPNLFKGDLYLNDIENVKYYTPFYIETIRFLSTITHEDYVLALNLFSLLLHFFVSCFLIGFIFNLHPITGIGGLLLFYGLIFSYIYFYKVKLDLKVIFLGIFFSLLGLVPFVITYFSKTSFEINYNYDDYKLAFSQRINSVFENPKEYLMSWIRFKTLFYIVPLFLFGILSIKFKKYRPVVLILLFLTIILIIIPTSTILLEKFINEFLHKNIRMSFQIVRAQKLAILPCFFALGFLLIHFSKKISNNLLTAVVYSLIFLISISKFNFFNSMPFFGDDIARSVFPSFKEINKPIIERQSDIDKMAIYIKENTPKNAIFYNNNILRVASKRSVILDGKGASMLIEGNPSDLINWHKDRKMLKSKESIGDSLSFIKSKGADYLISEKIINSNQLKFVYKIDSLILYKIN